MITFCIPSKNNLRYLKLAIESITNNSYYTNDILVYVDKDEDGTVDWLKKNQVNYVLNDSAECKGIGYAYDTLFNISNTDLVVAFHADMVLGKHADLNMIKHHKERTIVSATRIEPPLHPPSQEKIVMDFGMWPEDFDRSSFDQFVIQHCEKNKDATIRAIFAPWLIDRRDHLGHDDMFKSVFEDTDLFRRFVLAGYNIVQSWDSLVYHLTCRGGQFFGAEKKEDFLKKDQQWLINNRISMLEYVRKWGGYPIDISPCEPLPNTKYNIGFAVKNCTEEILSLLEPLCDNIHLEGNSELIVKNYIEKNQGGTSFDLRRRIKKQSEEMHNDIIISFDARDLNQETFQILQQFPQIIKDSGSIGYLELEPFKFAIVSMKTYEKEMIYPTKKLS